MSTEQPNGLRIGQYEIISTLGRGSIGVVYKARDPRMDRIVAIKALKSVFLGDNSPDNIEVRRFYQESKSAGKLRHPNIVTFHDVGITDLGSPYIVMEYIEGDDIATIIDARAPVDTSEVLQYIFPIASAIDYAHSEGVLHRDITPNNIIIDKSRRPYLLDFSLAKLVNASITPTGAMLGSPGYMAPELVNGLNVTHLIDVFSLAAVSFEMLTGHTPFAGEDMIRMVYSVMNEPPKRFQELGVMLPIEVEKVLHRALEKNPQNRYQTATQFAEALRDAVTGGVIGTMSLPVVKPPEKAIEKDLVPRQESIVNNIMVSEEPKKDEVQEMLNKTIHGGAKGDYIDTSSTGSFVLGDDGNYDNFSPKSYYVEPPKKGILFFALLILWSIFGIYLALDKFYPIFTHSIRSYIAVNLGEKLSNLRVSESERLPASPDLYKRASNTKVIGLLRNGIVDNNTNSITRFRALIFEAGTRNNSELRKLLMRLSLHEDELIRIEALKALATDVHIKKEGVVEAFIIALDDEDYLVRAFAVRSLGKLSGKRVVTSLKKRRKQERNDQVIALIDQTLGQY